MTIKNSVYVVVLSLLSLVGLVGCADDDPPSSGGCPEGACVVSGGTGGTGGRTSTGGTTATGGRTSTGGTYATGGNCTGGTVATGGTTAGDWSQMPGAWLLNTDQVFSFNVLSTDSYASTSYWEGKVRSMRECATTADCMIAARDDRVGRQFQWIAYGSSSPTDTLYYEEFVGQMKGFCVYRNSDVCGETLNMVAGEGCTDRATGQARECLVSAAISFSVAAPGSASPFVTLHRIPLIPESGDECLPMVVCYGSEHGTTIYRDGSIEKGMTRSISQGTMIQRGNTSTGALPLAQ